MDRTDLEGVRAHAFSERRRTALAYAPVIPAALLAAGGTEHLMQHAAPWLVTLLVSEIACVAVLLAGFEAMTRWLDLYEWPTEDVDVDDQDELFPGSLALVRAHLDAKCGCTPGTALGDCPPWIDALAADDEIGGKW